MMSPQRQRLLRFLAVGTVALLAVSCSTRFYSGERRSREEVARLKENPKQFMSGYFVTLWEVNGGRVHDATFGIDVPPGRTRMTVLVHSPPTRGNRLGYRKVSRTITAKAGYEYILESVDGKLVVQERLNQSLIDKLKKGE